MGWKAFARSLAAAQRQAERDAMRRRRALLAMAALQEKLELRDRAKLAVDTYENYIEVLLSMHKDCGPVWNWAEISTSKPPSEPPKQSTHETVARVDLENYRPSWFAKLFGKAERVRQRLQATVEAAQQLDAKIHTKSMEEHAENVRSWDSMRALARRVLEGDPAAYQQALSEIDPFSEIKAIGSKIAVAIPGSTMAIATLHVNGEDIVPKESVTLLKSGKLSSKALPKSRFYEIYQDYVCGATIRVARELMAALPIQIAVVTSMAPMLNSSTGHMEDQPILSLAVPRKTIDNINFATIDPSDSLANFVHNMKYQKTKGFNPVAPVDPASLSFT